MLALAVTAFSVVETLVDESDLFASVSVSSCLFAAVFLAFVVAESVVV